MEQREKLEARLAHLRPILAAGGKAIEIISIESPKVVFAVKGFCSGCECSTSYREGLEELVRDTCPELTDICFAE